MAGKTLDCSFLWGVSSWWRIFNYCPQEQRCTCALRGHAPHQSPRYNPVGHLSSHDESDLKRYIMVISMVHGHLVHAMEDIIHELLMFAWPTNLIIMLIQSSSLKLLCRFLKFNRGQMIFGFGCLIQMGKALPGQHILSWWTVSIYGGYLGHHEIRYGGYLGKGKNVGQQFLFGLHIVLDAICPICKLTNKKMEHLFSKSRHAGLALEALLAIVSLNCNKIDGYLILGHH